MEQASAKLLTLRTALFRKMSESSVEIKRFDAGLKSGFLTADTRNLLACNRPRFPVKRYVATNHQTSGSTPAPAS